jgi:hypothetical protein
MMKAVNLERCSRHASTPISRRHRFVRRCVFLQSDHNLLRGTPHREVPRIFESPRAGVLFNGFTIVGSVMAVVNVSELLRFSGNSSNQTSFQVIRWPQSLGKGKHRLADYIVSTGELREKGMSDSSGNRTHCLIVSLRKKSLCWSQSRLTTAP